MPQLVKRAGNLIYVESDIDCTIDIFLREETNYVLQETFNLVVSFETYYIFKVPKDGIYKAVVTTGNTTTGIISVEHVLPIFPSLIENVAKEFKHFVCDGCEQYIKDCACGDMKRVAAAALKYNNLAGKILYLETNVLFGYNDAVKGNYLDFLFNSLKTVGCKSDALLERILKEECIYGISKNTELYSLLLIVRVLGIYYLELHSIYNIGDDVYDTIGEITTNIPDLYLYEEWKDCLCNTCLRVKDLEEIFENGVVDTQDPITNLPPKGDNIVRTLYSNNNFYQYTLTQQEFSNVFADDNDNFPTKIKIITVPSKFTLEDINGNTVQVLDELNYSEIQNYVLAYTVSSYEKGDSFKFAFIDSEGLVSPHYIYQLFISTIYNSPPIVSKGFTKLINEGSTTIIRKDELFNVGSVTDPEGDNITHFKVVSLVNVTLEYWNGISWSNLLLNTEIDMSNNSDFSDFIRVTETVPPDDSSISLVFKDGNGSNTWSNDNNPLNVMLITVKTLYKINMLFTGGYLHALKLDFNWMPIARIEYNGDPSELKVEDVNQGTSVDANFAYLIVPATSDTPYGTYDNSDAIVIDGTDNPTINSYDIYFYMNILNNRNYNFKVRNDNNAEVSIASDIVVISYGNNKPIKIEFVEFNTSDIADFDHLEVTDTWEPKPYSTNVDLDYDELVAGKDITVQGNGLIGFALYTNEVRNPAIFDDQDTNITSLFKRFYNSKEGIELFISKSAYSPSTTFVRFEF